MTRQPLLYVLVVVVIAALFLTRMDRALSPPERIHASFVVRSVAQTGRMTLLTVQRGYQIRSFGVDPMIRAGDRIVVSGVAYPVESEGLNLGVDYARYLRSTGIRFVLQAQEVQLLEQGRNVYTLRDAARRRIGAGIDNLYGTSAPVLKALVYGEQLDPEEPYRDLFARTGTAHVLALSGFHVGVVALLIAVVLQHIGVKARGAGMVALLALYALLTGLRASILRAVGFFALYYIAFLRRRQYNLIAAASLMMILLLAYNPYYLYHRGFILSFAGVFSIACFYPVLRSVAQVRGWRLYAPLRLLLVTLSAQVLTLPISLYYFGVLPLVAPFANLLAVPLISIILPLAICSVLLHELSGIWLMLRLPDRALAAVVETLVRILIGILERLQNLPHAYREDIALSLGGLLAVVSAACIGYIVWEIKTIEGNRYEPQRIQATITESESIDFDGC